MIILLMLLCKVMMFIAMNIHDICMFDTIDSMNDVESTSKRHSSVVFFLTFSLQNVRDTQTNMPHRRDMI